MWYFFKLLYIQVLLKYTYHKQALKFDANKTIYLKKQHFCRSRRFGRAQKSTD
jgi:hypothetical protein